MTTKESILRITTKLLARNGVDGTTMREVAEQAGVRVSVIYHYFPTKDDLLRATRISLNEELDKLFDTAPAVATVDQLLRQRIALSLKHREQIVALLQYFMSVKNDFPKQANGYLSPRAYRHMREIIDQGIVEGQYSSADPDFDAKTVSHMVNGFLMEVYPHKLSAHEQSKLATHMAYSIERLLRGVV